jgi:hypothetical protein
MNKQSLARFLPHAALVAALWMTVMFFCASVKGIGHGLAHHQGLGLWASDTGFSQASDLEKIPGFRVQVYQGSSRVRAKEIRDLMVLQYSKLGVYMGFRQPDFRVRVGDFRDKAKAQAYLLMLKGEYPSAFVVPDKVLLYPQASEEGSPTLNEDGFED